MKYEITNLPRKYFYEIAQLPHGSTNEKPVSDYLVEFAKAHNLEYMQDDMWNVIIRKPASAGYEDAPVLSIQAHMDMVPEKVKESNHDFTKDPLEFIVDDNNILRANGTTLGADDGTGVAYMLSLLSDETVVGPKLECIFTVQEEIGMFGALNLKPEDVQGRRIISLDGGGETSTLLTSAGGCRVALTRDMMRINNELPCYAIRIRGLAGGHSGGEIHKEKGNSIKLMSRILKEAMLAGFSFRLVEINGGAKDNAIARDCDAVIAFDGNKEELEACVRNSEKNIWTELEFSDPKFMVEFIEVEKSPKSYCPKCTKAFVDMVFLIPNGFQNRSMAIEGLTMTSLNMGILNSYEDKVVLTMSLRSMLKSCLDNMVNQITTICDLYGTSVETSSFYPGWKYSEKNSLRDTMAECVKDLYGKELTLIAAHGGTECGVWALLHPEMEIVSCGPKSGNVHTPDEWLDLESFDRTYNLLKEIVKRSH